MNFVFYFIVFVKFAYTLFSGKFWSAISSCFNKQGMVACPKFKEVSFHIIVFTLSRNGSSTKFSFILENNSSLDEEQILLFQYSQYVFSNRVGVHG